MNMTRFNFIKHGLGMASILACHKAPAFVRSMIGFRQAIITSTEHDSSNSAADYIQDGLVAMYDGIENVGYGVHDDTSTEWVDLTGINGNATLSEFCRWTDKGIENTSSEGNVYTKNATFTIPSPLRYAGLIKASKELTIEFIFTPGVNMTGNYVTGPQLASASSRYCRIWNQNNISPLYIDNNGYGLFKPLSLRIYDYHSPTYVACSTYATGENTAYGDGYINGIHMKSTDSSEYGGFNYSDVFATTRTCSNTIHHSTFALRYYNRCLTAEEVSHNYMIDRERFGE